MALLTGILQRQLQLFLTAEDCLFKSDAHRRMDICPFHRTVARPSSGASSAEQIAENIAEDIAHIRAAEAAKTTEAAIAAGTAAALFKGRMAELVVLLSLLGIT